MLITFIYLSQNMQDQHDEKKKQYDKIYVERQISLQKTILKSVKSDPGKYFKSFQHIVISDVFHELSTQNQAQMQSTTIQSLITSLKQLQYQSLSDIYNSKQKRNYFLSLLFKNLAKNGFQILNNQSNNKNFTIKLINQTKNHQVISIQCRVGRYSKKFTFIISSQTSLKHKNKVIGTGAQGILYCTHNQKQKQNKVTKCIKFDILQLNILQSFIQEFFIADLMSCMQIGPKIYKTFGFSFIIYQDCIEFDMELCNQSTNTNIEKQLRSSLFKLHLLQFVHSDIKPGNVMYSPTYEKNVFIDFGISQYLIEEIGFKTQTSFKGTYEFCGDQMQKIILSKGCHFIDLYLNDAEMLQKSIQRIQFFNKSIQQGNYNNFIQQNHKKLFQKFEQKSKFQLDQQNYKKQLQQFFKITTQIKLFLFQYQKNYLYRSNIIQNYLNQKFKTISNPQIVVKLLQKIIYFSFHLHTNTQLTVKKYLLSVQNTIKLNFNINPISQNKLKLLLSEKNSQFIEKQPHYFSVIFQFLSNHQNLNKKQKQSERKLNRYRTQQIPHKIEDIQFILINQSEIKKFQLPILLQIFLIYVKYFQPTFTISFSQKNEVSKVMKKFLQQLIIEGKIKLLQYFTQDYLPQYKFVKQNGPQLVWVYAFLINYCTSNINPLFAIQHLMSIIKQCIFLQIKVHRFIHDIFVKYFELLIKQNYPHLFSKFIVELNQIRWIYDEIICIDSWQRQDQKFLQEQKYIKFNTKRLVRMFKEIEKTSEDEFNNEQKKQKLNMLISILACTYYCDCIEFNIFDYKKLIQFYLPIIKSITKRVNEEYKIFINGKQTNQKSHSDIKITLFYNAIFSLSRYYVINLTSDLIYFNKQFIFDTNLNKQTLEYVTDQTKELYKYKFNNFFPWFINLVGHKFMISSQIKNYFGQQKLSIMFFIHQNISQTIKYQLIQKLIYLIKILIYSTINSPFLFNTQFILKIAIHHDIASPLLSRVQHISQQQMYQQIINWKNYFYNHFLKVLKGINSNPKIMLKNNKIKAFFYNLKQYLQLNQYRWERLQSIQQLCQEIHQVRKFIQNQSKPQIVVSNSCYIKIDELKIYQPSIQANQIDQLNILYVILLLQQKNTHDYSKARKQFLQKYLQKIINQSQNINFIPIKQQSTLPFVKLFRFFQQNHIFQNQILNKSWQSLIIKKQLFLQKETFNFNFHTLFMTTLYSQNYLINVHLIINFCKQLYNNFNYWNFHNKINTMHSFLDIVLSSTKGQKYLQFILTYLKQQYKTHFITQQISLFFFFTRFVKCVKNYEIRKKILLSCWKMFSLFPKTNYLFKQVSTNYKQQWYLESLRIYDHFYSNKIDRKKFKRKRNILVYLLIKNIQYDSKFLRGLLLYYIEEYKSQKYLQNQLFEDLSLSFDGNNHRNKYYAIVKQNLLIKRKKVIDNIFPQIYCKYSGKLLIQRFTQQIQFLQNYTQSKVFQLNQRLKIVQIEKELKSKFNFLDITSFSSSYNIQLQQKSNKPNNSSQILNKQNLNVLNLYKKYKVLQKQIQTYQQNNQIFNDSMNLQDIVLKQVDAANIVQKIQQQVKAVKQSQIYQINQSTLSLLHQIIHKQNLRLQNLIRIKKLDHQQNKIHLHEQFYTVLNETNFQHH